MRSPTEMVKNGQTVHFTHAYQGNLWYVTECGFRFPVPVEDIGAATFEATDKALLFLRYIRRQHTAPLAVFPVADHPHAEGISVRFVHYRQGSLWYVTADGFTFPVPIAASNACVFLAQNPWGDKFVPHVARHRALLDTARQAQENVS